MPHDQQDADAPPDLDLEQELADNAWLSVLATDHILFDLPAEERLPAAMALLGIDYATLSDEAGHA